MDAKRLYTHLYRLLDKATPIGADCGKLCGAACCKGDEDTGMYLFPFEEVMYDGSEKWLRIYESDFYVNGKAVKIAICSGICDRKKDLFRAGFFRCLNMVAKRSVRICAQSTYALWRRQT